MPVSPERHIRQGRYHGTFTKSRGRLMGCAKHYSHGQVGESVLSLSQLYFVHAACCLLLPVF